ncbi:MAG: hypothetical protein JWN70_5445 [Planctomycetaceae bacterium]|nr:hypothetical protein [Planctomycetaceae bacterium]
MLTLYDVGPNLAYTSIGAVPWSGLQAGDTVAIHYRPEAYHETILISTNGTADAPIRVIGVPGPNGERPIIDGQDAVIDADLNYVYSAMPTRGVITVSVNSNYTLGDKPSYIEISGLEARNAHVGNSLIRPDHSTVPYLSNAAGIYVERGEHITIADCEIDHNSNGLFVASGETEDLQSRDILIRGNYLHDNGNVGDDRHHNAYTEAIGITYEDNHFGPLLPGSGGNNLKDRSAGLVVKNNWIEGGAHLLDLVDAEDSYGQAGADPRYQQTFVYGNILINLSGPGNSSNLVHYGGDSGEDAIYRTGTLYFYNNTVFIQGSREGTPDARYTTEVFRFDSNAQIGDIRNNIFYAMGDPAYPDVAATGLALMDSGGGTAYFANNWISPGWATWRNDQNWTNGVITGTDSFISNPENDPGFVDPANFNLHLSDFSQALDQSGPLVVAAIGQQEPTDQYVVHQGHTARDVIGTALDLGAFEGSSAAGPAGPGHLQFQVTAQSVLENAGVAHIIVRRVGGTTGAVTVHYTTLAGTAKADTEFTAISGTLEFADGQSTAEIDVAILDNLFSGANKSLQIQLSNPTDGATLGSSSLLALTIQNNEPTQAGPSTVQFSKTTYSASVASGQLIVTISRTGDLSLPGQIHIETKAGSAKTRALFNALSQTINFAPGQQSQQVTIELVNQAMGNTKRTFQLKLTSPSGGISLGRQGKVARVTLHA